MVVWPTFPHGLERYSRDPGFDQIQFGIRVNADRIRYLTATREAGSREVGDVDRGGVANLSSWSGKVFSGSRI